MAGKKSWFRYPGIPFVIWSVAALLTAYAFWALRTPESSSQATAVATVALCLITGLYAWFTNRLVEQNQQQLAELRRSTFDVRRARAVIFVHLADRIGVAVKELPACLSDPGFDKAMRAGVLWRPEELPELEQLAAYLGPWVSMPLVQIVSHLRWMSLRVDEVRAVNERIGFDYSEFPAEKWEYAWKESTRQLMIIAGLARNEVSRLESEAEIT